VESPPPIAGSTPVSTKKPLIDNMLAPEQKTTFIREKAAELFVDGCRGDIVVSVWCDCVCWMSSYSLMLLTYKWSLVPKDRIPKSSNVVLGTSVV